uniref:Membrane protein E3 RID-beta n=1 Tax=Human mastadenovirus C TaxID=129951 RepID=A0A7M3SYT8_9ADEN|nr:membrane protein E3 RID-beta [Human mastadenovirus C]
MKQTVIFLLILCTIPALFSQTSAPPKRLISCRFTQIWNIPNCYNKHSDLSEAWLYAIISVMVFCSTIFALAIYPYLHIGWNAIDAMNHPTFPAPAIIPLQQVVAGGVAPANQPPPPSPTPTEISYFNLTGGDD